MIGIRPTRLELSVHIGKLSLNNLEVTDFLVKLLPVINIGQCNVEGVLHNTDGASREQKSFIVKTLHQHIHALVNMAE